jgi:hypothetical protein
MMDPCWIVQGHGTSPRQAVPAPRDPGGTSASGIPIRDVFFLNHPPGYTLISIAPPRGSRENQTLQWQTSGSTSFIVSRLAGSCISLPNIW